MILNTKTYAFSGILAGISTWIERSLKLSQLFSTLTGSVVVDTKARVKWRLKVPYAVASDSTCGCAGDVRGVADLAIDIRFDNSLDDADRLDMLDRLQDLVLTTQFASSVTNLEQPNS